MQKVLYLDSIFLHNLVPDFLILRLILKTLRKSTTFFRVMGGAAAGAGMYCITLCLPGSLLSGIFVKVITALLMLKITAPFQKGKELLTGMLLYFTFAFFLGGGMLFVKRLLLENSIRVQGELLMLSGMAIYGLAAFLQDWKQRKMQTHFCRVWLPGDDGNFAITGLIDTGNGLIEPVSRKPVAVLDEVCFEKMSHCKRPEKYRIIPFHSIGTERGMLDAYEIEEIQLEEETGRRRLKQVMIAVCRERVSGRKKYQMILPQQWFL